MNMIYLCISALLIHAVFYICFPNIPDQTGNWFMLFSAIGWCIFALIGVPIHGFLKAIAKYFGFLSVVGYYVLLIGFLGVMMPQADNRSPFEQLMNGNWPTVSTMKGGYARLTSALRGLERETNEVIKKGSENVSIEAIKKAAD